MNIVRHGTTLEIFGRPALGCDQCIAQVFQSLLHGGSFHRCDDGIAEILHDRPGRALLPQGLDLRQRPSDLLLAELVRGMLQTIRALS